MFLRTWLIRFTVVKLINLSPTSKPEYYLRELHWMKEDKGSGSGFVLAHYHVSHGGRERCHFLRDFAYGGLRGWYPSPTSTVISDEMVMIDERQYERTLFVSSLLLLQLSSSMLLIECTRRRGCCPFSFTRRQQQQQSQSALLFVLLRCFCCCCGLPCQCSSSSRCALCGHRFFVDGSWQASCSGNS